MPTTNDYDQLVSSFELRELTGDQRTVTLKGRALPYRPFTLAGKQRNSIDWYNGNPIGVLQVYGAEEDKTTVNGWWKDVFIGDPNAIYATVNGFAINTVRDLADLIDDIRRKGQEIVVTWMDRTRFGLLELFTQKWHTGHDLEWDMTFAWIGQDDVQLSLNVPFVTDNSAADLVSVPNDIQDGVTQLSTPTIRLQEEGINVGGAINGFVTAFSDEYQSLVEDADGIANTISDQSDELQDTLSNVATIATAPNDAQRRIAGILDGIKLEAGDCRQTFGLIEGARLNLGGPFGDVLADRSSSRQQAMTATQIQVTAAAQEAKILRALSQEIIMVFTARAGDTLLTASQIFYGTPDNWQDLMLYNNLVDSVLVAGQVVIAPQRLASSTS